MKTNIFFYSALAVFLILTACQKEDESKNPYQKDAEQTSYFFTDSERELIIYNLTDSFSLIYDDYDTIQFKVKTISHDTLINSNSKKYEQVLIRFQREMYNMEYEAGYYLMHKKDGSLDVEMSLTNGYPTPNITINTVAEQYDTKIINGIEYNNVYRVERDSSRNNEHVCFIKRAYISPTQGIIQVYEDCYKYEKAE